MDHSSHSHHGSGVPQAVPISREIDTGPVNSKCIGISTSFLVVINCLTFLLGLGIAGSGTYVWTNAAKIGGETLSTTLIIATMVLGGIIFLISFVGVFGAVKRAKFALSFYSIVIFMIVAGEIICTILLANYVGLLTTLDTKKADGTSLTGKTEGALNDLMYNSYMVCCKNNKAFCPGITSNDTSYCYPVLSTCPDPIGDAICYSAPSGKDVGGEVCVALNSTGLIGPALQGGVACGAGSPKAFKENMSAWIRENINVLFYTVGGTAFIEMLALIFAGILIFKSDDIEKQKELHDREEEVVAYEMNHPVESRSLSVNDQRPARTDSMRSNASRTMSINSRPLSMAQTTPQINRTLSEASANNARPQSTIIDVPIDDRGRTMSIDARSGLQVARPVTDDNLQL